MDYGAFIVAALVVIFLELAFGLSSLKNKLDEIATALNLINGTLTEIRDDGVAQREED